MTRTSVLLWLWVITSNSCEETLASRAKVISSQDINSQCHLLPVQQCSNLEPILLLKTAKINSEAENPTGLTTEILTNHTNKTFSFSSKPGMSAFWKIGASLAVIVLMTLCLISYWIMTMSKTAQLLNRFPGHPIMPVIGSILTFISPKNQIVEKMGMAVQKYGRCFRLWLFWSPYIIITEAKSAQTILSSSKHIDKGRQYEGFRWLIGDGLFTSNGRKWHEDRKLLGPSFKYQSLDGFLNSFNKHSKVLVNILKKNFEKVESPGGCLNLYPILSLCTMDFVTEGALGQCKSFQNGVEVKFIETAHASLASFRRVILEPWFNLPIIWHICGFGREEKKCREYVDQVLGEVIDERRAFRSISDGGMGNKTKPFIDALLDTGKSRKEIIDHVMTILGAGYETTASGINYTLFLLSLNPECQAKVQQELDWVFSCEDAKNVDITFAQLAELKYLEMCIKEALRLYPPGPMFSRAIQEDIKLENGLTIPKGCDVAFFLYELHRDPLVFPDPEKFDPDRFLPEECAKRSLYAYVPFSLGPRNCIGQKYAMLGMKTALAHILRNFTVSTEQKREKLKLVYGLILEPSGGIHLKLKARN